MRVLPALVAAANATIRNPILPGFHPDPSCVFVPELDATFFCATSSFDAFPGLPLFASKDLQHFRHISDVLSRPTQLPALATTNGSTSGLWAPSVRFHAGTFWVVSTLVFDHLPQTDAARWDNLIFRSTNPYDSASWSDPVHFTFEGYDASPFWDPSDPDASYIVASHAWRVEEMIMAFQLDFATGEQIGPTHDLWPGTGGIAPEAPHLFARPDAFYLAIAEGGTGLGHEVNVARSPTLLGTYTGSPHNPLLTASNTSNFFQTVGHADLFQDAEGHWWAVALATRGGPEYTYFPMGRETVLTPASWNAGGFPVFDVVEGIEHGPLPPTNVDVDSTGYWVGTTHEHITFAPGTSLPTHFVHQRLPDPTAYTVSPPSHPDRLALTPSVLNLTALDARTAATPQTFVGRRQEHVRCVFGVGLEFDNAEWDGAEAGVTVFLHQGQHFDLGVVMLSPSGARAAGYTGPPLSNDSPLARYIRLRTITAASSDEGARSPFSGPAVVPLPLTLSDDEKDGTVRLRMQIDAVNETTYVFRYAPFGVGEFVDVGWGNSSEVSGGFMGTLVGVFATGNGRAVPARAFFSDWTYTGFD